MSTAQLSINHILPQKILNYFEVIKLDSYFKKNLDLSMKSLLDMTRQKE